MSTDAIITLVVVIGALILFLTEVIAIDLVALLIMAVLIVTGVVTPAEGVSGFSHDATLTVMFMFVLSAALFKTGALQTFGARMGNLFKVNFSLGLVGLMVVVGIFSAFLNNTPIVALFIPICIQLATAAGKSPSKILIPLSFATILGGTITLIGTSTNLVVSGLSEKSGGPALSMFDPTPLGLIYFVVGILFMAFIGIKLLPDRNAETDLKSKFGMRNYLTEIEIQPGAPSNGKLIKDSVFSNQFDMDVLEVRRNTQRFSLPPGDFLLQSGDMLKVRCNVEKMQKLKEYSRIQVGTPLKIGDEDLAQPRTTLVEMMLPADSDFIGQTLRDLDLRPVYRAIPLALRHREDVLHENFYDVPLMAGDIILAEVKNHYLKELKAIEQENSAPFILLSENVGLHDFNKKRFALVSAISVGVIGLATLEIVPMLVAALLGVVAILLTKSLSMREMYESISWNVVFLLAGTLCLGAAMKNCGLDLSIADFLVSNLHGVGPVAVVSGLYLITAILTEIMSNNATAALLTPIAVAMANRLGVDPMPFLITIMFGASACFLTPVGYQTNAMVYAAGNYKFSDFSRVGGGLAILLWIMATIFIPILYPF